MKSDKKKPTDWIMWSHIYVANLIIGIIVGVGYVYLMVLV